MNQSDRLRCVKAYQSNPLRGEYERKKSIICSNQPFIVYLINLGYLFFFGMFIFYGWIFFSSDNEIAIAFDDFIQNTFGLFFLGTILILAFGITNIILGGIYLLYSFEWKEKLTEKHNSAELEKLYKEYREKGLYPCYEHELFNHSCCDYDDVYEMFVCPITKKMIKNADFNYCNTPGNCRYCKTFMIAYLGEDCGGEFKHEFK